MPQRRFYLFGAFRLGLDRLFGFAFDVDEDEDDDDGSTAVVLSNQGRLNSLQQNRDHKKKTKLNNAI